VAQRIPHVHLDRYRRQKNYFESKRNRLEARLKQAKAREGDAAQSLVFFKKPFSFSAFRWRKMRGDKDCQIGCGGEKLSGKQSQIAAFKTFWTFPTTPVLEEVAPLGSCGTSSRGGGALKCEEPTEECLGPSTEISPWSNKPIMSQYWKHR
jgi:hypothetical protein